MYSHRRSILVVGLLLAVTATLVVACGPSDAPPSAPADLPAESYPGGVPPSEQEIPPPAESYPGGVRPTDPPIPTREGYPQPTTGMLPGGALPNTWHSAVAGPAA